MALINMYDVMQETFDDELLKSVLALEGVMGSHMGPRSPQYRVRITSTAAWVRSMAFMGQLKSKAAWGLSALRWHLLQRPAA